MSKWTFENEEYAKKVLLHNNYYNIINGYKDLFLNNNSPNYKNGTKFEEIYALYEFDRQIRNIFLEYILKIENSLRALVAYYFSEEYGNDNYLKLDNFETFNNVNVNIETKQKQIKFIHNLIGNINKNIIAFAIIGVSGINKIPIDITLNTTYNICLNDR